MARDEDMEYTYKQYTYQAIQILFTYIILHLPTIYTYILFNFKFFLIFLSRAMVKIKFKK